MLLIILSIVAGAGIIAAVIQLLTIGPDSDSKTENLPKEELRIKEKGNIGKSSESFPSDLMFFN